MLAFVLVAFASPALATHPTGQASPFFVSHSGMPQAGGTTVVWTEAHMTCDEASQTCQTRWRHNSTKSGTSGNCSVGVTRRGGWFNQSGSLIGSWTTNPTNSITPCRSEAFGAGIAPETGHNTSSIAPSGAYEYKEQWVRASDNFVYAEASSVAPNLAPPEPYDFGLVTTSPGGKLLTYDQVAALGFRNGWTTEQALTEMVAVTRAESSFRTAAVSYTGCCHGLMQVNTEVHPYTPEQMRDPDQNVAAGRSIYVAAGSWQPWEAYTGPDGAGSDGPWLQYESYARAAAKRQIASGGSAYDSIASSPSVGSGSVTVGWSTACADCTYRVSRRQGSNSWAELGTTENLSFTDNNANDGTTYDYRVRAENENGESDWVQTTITTGQPDPDNGGVVGGTPEDRGSDDDGSNSGTGEDCWSINPITVLKCALRWAFVPGEATSEAWEELHDNLRTKPPFSVVSAVFGFVSWWVDEVMFRFESEHAALGFCFDLSLPEETSIPETAACFDEPLLELAENPLVETLRVLQSMFIIWAASLTIWRILNGAFGGKTQEAARTVDEDAPERKDEA